MDLTRFGVVLLVLIGFYVIESSKTRKLERTIDKIGSKIDSLKDKVIDLSKETK